MTFTFGSPGSSLSVSVATWYCNIFMFSAIMWEAAPFCSFRLSSLLALIMSASLWVKSSCNQKRNIVKPQTTGFELTENNY